MNYRQLGGTEIVVSEIGFGAWGIGGISPGATSYGKMEDSVSRQAIELALEKGVNFFDTAPAYGNGHSEVLLGEVLSSIRSKVILATKVGIDDFENEPDFSSHGVRLSLYGSLQRLKTDHIDLLQLHNFNVDKAVANPSIWEELIKFKAEGLIREYGITVKSPLKAIELLKRFQFSTVQVNLNMLDLRALDCGLLDFATRNKIGIIGRTPMAFGFLSGGIDRELQFPASDHRTNWPKQQLERWLEASDLLFGCIGSLSGVSRAIQAIRFCLALEGLSTVIPGMLKPSEVLENTLASQLGQMAKSDVETLKSEYAKIKDWLLIK
jgi:aryl-alcohol dehydrogenase-like predicted oxidoreductase